MNVPEVSRRKLLRGALWSAAGIAVSTGGLNLLDESERIRVDRYTLRLPRWDADGFRLAVLGDLHANTGGAAERASRAIALAVRESPDAIALVGDFLNHTRPDVFAHVRLALDTLPRDIPVVSVPGNHDYPREGAWEALELLRSMPMTFLENRVVEFQGVRFYGMEDGIRGQDRHDLLPASADRNTIGMLHEPDLVERCDPRLSLMLAGHSHGGQICLPGGVPLITPRYAKKYVSGFYPHAKAPLFVTRGVGTARNIEFRLLCPPEVAILTLVTG